MNNPIKFIKRYRRIRELFEKVPKIYTTYSHKKYAIEVSLSATDEDKREFFRNHFDNYSFDWIYNKVIDEMERTMETDIIPFLRGNSKIRFYSGWLCYFNNTGISDTHDIADTLYEMLKLNESRFIAKVLTGKISQDQVMILKSALIVNLYVVKLHWHFRANLEQINETLNRRYQIYCITNNINRSQSDS